MNIPLVDILEVLSAARLELHTGQVDNQAAVAWCVKHGLVSYSFKYPLGLLGLSNLRLSESVDADL